MAPFKRKYVAQSMTGKPQSSIYRGVSLHKGTSKYRANIKIKGKKIALGAYDSEVDAAKAFDRAAIRYRGARAEVNFPVIRSKKPDAEQADGTSSESSSNPADSHPAARPSAGSADSFAESQDTEPQTKMYTRSMATEKRKDEEEEEEEMMLIMNMGDLDWRMDLSDVLDFERQQNQPRISPFQTETSPFSDASATDDPEEPLQTQLDMPAGGQKRKAACWEASDDGGNRKAAFRARRLVSQPSICSRDTNTPASHGYSVMEAHFDLRRGPATCEPTPAAASTHTSGRLTIDHYRDLLMQRAMEDGDSSSDEASWNPLQALQPVLFDSAALASRNAWWRRQLQLEHAMRMQYEEDAAEAMYGSYWHGRACRHAPAYQISSLPRHTLRT